jgi:hypothetical protein
MHYKKIKLTRGPILKGVIRAKKVGRRVGQGKKGHGVH